MNKKQIMIVEHDQKSLHMLKELLEVDGYEVILTTSTLDALDKYMSYFFDLVLSAIEFPESSGIELLKDLKKIDEDAVVVFLSSKNDWTTYRQAIRYGAADFIDKPPDIMELSNTIKQCLQKRAFIQKTKTYHEGLETIVEERTETLKLQKEALEKEQQRTQSIIHEAHIGFLILDGESEEIFMINRRGKELFRLKRAFENRYFLRNYQEVFPKNIVAKIKKMLKKIRQETKVIHFGKFFIDDTCIVNIVSYPIITKNTINSIVIVIDDITEQTTLEKQILQSSRLAGIGELAAGIAHEINNPIAFVSSNTYMIGKYFQRIISLLEEYNILESQIKNISSDKNITEQIEKLSQLKEELKIEKALKNIEEIIAENIDGLNRVKKIVSDLKTFSYMGEEKEEETDINQVMDNTLNIVWNEIKYKAEVIKKYGPNYRIYCFPRQISQIFANILINAAHAIKEKGFITIRTLKEEDKLKIEISDTGRGMSQEIAKKIFNPFFTTKEASKGTGLGLSIAYKLIEKHNGTISVSSKIGKGTTFTILLPFKKNKKKIRKIKK